MIVLTGSTGVVGMELLARLVERGDDEIVVLLRATSQEHADERLDTLLRRLWASPPATPVRALAADVTAPGLGLSRADRRDLAATATRVVHCAASVGFTETLADALAVNALGTQRVLELANDLRDLDRVVHVSTAYVAGDHRGRFREDDLIVGQRFRNSYEQSKHLAERLVDAADLPIVVARPSIVVGDAQTGWTPAFTGLYLPLRAYARGLLGEVSADPRGIVDVVSLDYVAGALVELLDDPAAIGCTFHLVAGEHAATVADLIRLVEPRFAQPPATIRSHRGGEGAVEKPLLPYFDVRTRFDEARAAALLGERGLRPRPLDELFPAIADYAEATRWGREPMTREAAAAGGAGRALSVLA